MKYKQNSLFGGHFGRHLEFQYEESRSRLGTRARKFAHCIIFNIKLSNLFSGGGGTKIFFCSTGFCTIMEETKHFKSFPSESIGYQFYDYARYYLRNHQDQDAAQMAKLSVEYFMQENRDDDGSPNRQILAVSQFAMIKLGCGEEFDTYDQAINNDDIVKVEEYLGQLGAVANDQPSVQLTDYLLAVCDLNYRKGNIEKAIEAAQRCLKIAGEKGIEDEILWARNRLKILSRLKTKMNMQDKRDATRKQLDSK